MEIPDHLEQRVILVDVEDEEKVCPVTGEPMAVARYEDTRKLEFVASKLICNVYRRPVYVSPDRSARVPPLMPSLPAFADDRLKADAGLLGFAVVAKFADALPLYRQQAIWRRQGFELSPSTLDGWVLHVAAALAPLYGLHKAEVLATGYVGSDDTSVTVLVPGEPGSDTGRFWCALGYRLGLAPLVIFEFTLDRLCPTASSPRRCRGACTAFLVRRGNRTVGRSSLPSPHRAAVQESVPPRRPGRFRAPQARPPTVATSHCRPMGR